MGEKIFRSCNKLNSILSKTMIFIQIMVIEKFSYDKEITGLLDL